MISLPVPSVPAGPFSTKFLFRRTDPCSIPAIPGSRNLHERKLATWALLVGETHSSDAHAQMRRRPHRGMLPDVDFSRAVPDYGRPSLVRRLFGLFRRGAASTDDGERQEVCASPVGEKPSASYIARTVLRLPADSQEPRAHAARARAA
ncbi:hypothetical protein [Aquamicrobium terrae]